MQKYTIILATLFVCLSAKSAPVFNYSYSISFQETVVYQSGSVHTKGQFFYDPANNKERKDVQSSSVNLYCYTVMPNVDTACTSLITGGRRWIIFPQRSQCCLCCTNEQGCGILRQDWLRDSSYQGESKIEGTVYDKWQMPGATSRDYYYFYTSTDSSQRPRRLDESGVIITDYDVATFERKDIPSSVFAVPSYCSTSNRCPKTSFCGYMKNSKKLQQA